MKPRQLRTLAFQALYLLDAHDGADSDDQLAASLEATAEDLSISPRPVDLEKAIALARAAYAGRRQADRAFAELAPEWPTQRQPAVDRAILRLAHHEMVSGVTGPKVAVNEAVELAKRFSTDRSPAFVNALLDKVLKRVLREGSTADAPAPAGDAAGGSA